MATDLKKVPTKGAGTSFARLVDGKSIDTINDFLDDANWVTLAKLKDIQPGEITVEDEEDNYLDDENSEWTKTSPGMKSAGETQLTIAWLPGETAQQQLAKDVTDGTITWYRAKYPNGAVDLYYGYVNSLGKAVAQKEKMTRSVKIKNVGKPMIAEAILAAASQPA
ncbi:phage tail tube protein [Photobacterium sp. 1_MG-2023]|uniref:phage tail tube protein n=1 Tax=Photobacterium sp. 1_MG-2023 TaxID=3062646 RepID=UPI0026E2E707|nr:phage tail tube protein [Photobacterium sp. 1_MG-2023]MDO6707922.1 phage tail tube protein [Photobacterium sp. 1_MG-2023]